MNSTIEQYQYTVKDNISCCGVGLHSGRTVNLTIKPAKPNSGIRFFRNDLPSNIHIQATHHSVVDTRLATTLGNEHFRVSTTEHLMAALRTYGIDNADVELDSEEIPIMDGSAEPFLALLKRTGRKKQSGYRQVIRIKKPVVYSNNGSMVRVDPYDGFKVTGEIEFDDACINRQQFSLEVNPESFSREISRARTFGFVEEVEELWANGLALGSSLANVIAIHWDRKSVLNEDGLRYEDEFIRHKVLDLVGDLALLGYPVLGHVTARRAGHTQHLGLMKAMAEAPDCWELVNLRDRERISSTKWKENVFHPVSKPFGPAVSAQAVS